MRTICLYFEIHQIIHLKRYRFFDIGTDHYYYDDYANETYIPYPQVVDGRCLRLSSGLRRSEEHTSALQSHRFIS